MRPGLRCLIPFLFALSNGVAAADLVEKQCGVVVVREDDRRDWVEVAELRILDSDRNQKLLAFTGAHVSSVWCERSSAIPAAFDYQVLLAGYPFLIKNGDQIAGLEWTSGKYDVRIMKGPAFTDDEQRQIAQRLAAYPPVPQIAANAPKDKPSKGTAEQLKQLDEALQPLIAKARSTYPDAKRRFLAVLPRDNIFSVTVRLHDADGRSEDVFLTVKAIQDGRIYGRIASEIELVKGFMRDDAYDLPESDIRDWTISRPDGSEEGNLIGKFLDTHRIDDSPSSSH